MRTETDLLHDLAGRQRRPKIGAEPDRVLGNEMNRALLDGVLDGSIEIRVADNGGLSFASADTTQEFRELTIEEITAPNNNDGAV
ncbi:MAG: hypothetical protein H8F28_03795 [Fibrella sp.]|nr:hypothetical protein [Armatimonadota bacterium]